MQRVKVSRKFDRLLKRYEVAFWADVEKGGTDPESWPEIEAEWKAARAALLGYVASVESAAAVAAAEGG